MNPEIKQQIIDQLYIDNVNIMKNALKDLEKYIKNPSIKIIYDNYSKYIQNLESQNKALTDNLNNLLIYLHQSYNDNDDFGKRVVQEHHKKIEKLLKKIN